ncbi:MAG: ABC transporter ATP-binding protein [Geminicoccaceae bacterium]
MTDPLLDVVNLSVNFPSPAGVVQAVRSVSFSLGQERLGIVGESGSGKTTVGRAILRLIPPPGLVVAKRMALGGLELTTLGERAMRDIRGERISMVMQDPKYSLNPVMQVGEQIAEAYQLHARASRREARQKSLDMLEAVRIRDPERVFHAYPHELSGGMGQRVMIAMMLIPDPDLLIADEPTSALDVTVQMQILAIIDDMVRERGMGLIFISHDLNLVASFCDRILIMYAGRIVEQCRADELHLATHPYTRGLLACLPRLDGERDLLDTLKRDPAWSS